MDLNRSLLRSAVIGVVLAGMTACPLTACGQNNPETYAYAKKLFDQHRAQLEQLVKLIRDCKYAQQIGSKSDFNVPSFPNLNACSNHSTAYRNQIARGLAKLGILWITVDWIGHRPNGTITHHEFSGASFVLSSYGLAAGPGGGSAIWYFVAPQTDITGLKPLTPPPYHWLYKKFD